MVIFVTCGRNPQWDLNGFCRWAVTELSKIPPTSGSNSSAALLRPLCTLFALPAVPALCKPSKSQAASSCGRSSDPDVAGRVAGRRRGTQVRVETKACLAVGQCQTSCQSMDTLKPQSGFGLGVSGFGFLFVLFPKP